MSPQSLPSSAALGSTSCRFLAVLRKTVKGVGLPAQLSIYLYILYIYLIFQSIFPKPSGTVDQKNKYIKGQWKDRCQDQIMAYDEYGKDLLC